MDNGYWWIGFGVLAGGLGLGSALTGSPNPAAGVIAGALLCLVFAGVGIHFIRSGNARNQLANESIRGTGLVIASKRRDNMGGGNAGYYEVLTEVTLPGRSSFRTTLMIRLQDDMAGHLAPGTELPVLAPPGDPTLVEFDLSQILTTLPPHP